MKAISLLNSDGKVTSRVHIAALQAIDRKGSISGLLLLIITFFSYMLILWFSFYLPTLHKSYILRLNESLMTIDHALTLLNSLKNTPVV
mgnify:CR=1 FL=1